MYRYNSLYENNLAEEAQQEKENIKNSVLKGGISYNKYVWHSENGEHTCDVCKLLDGQVFDFYDEVPERPHPNCKCYVEIVENMNKQPQNKKEDEEPCDCYKFIEQIDALLEEIKTLREVIAISMSNIPELLSYELSLGLNSVGQWLLEKFSKFDNLLGDLTSNFVESRENIFENSDKYYHTKAFCEVAQRESEINNMIALGAGRFREVLQGVESLINEEKTWSEAVKEYQADMAANKEGIELGKNNPNENCEIILKRVWPNKIETNY